MSIIIIELFLTKKKKALLKQLVAYRKEEKEICT